MKLTDKIRKILSVLLVFALFLSVAPANAFAAGEDAVVVISASDYQQNGAAPKTNTANILAQIQKDYPTADGFLAGGDYSQSMSTSATTSGKNELQGILRSYYGTGLHEIYVQGNHDPDETVSNGTLSSSGAHDTDDYGVYVINEMDYPWGYNTSDLKTVTKATANALDSYLDAKVAAGYNKPIFVVSHLPLHFTSRTSSQGDGKYAKYIYDVLNEGGENGLNIIFLFGHNHSGGYDAYLGNGAIYLGVGKTIHIANEGSSSSYYADELKFTYMNCGYVGYMGGSADTTLTMAVFVITDDQVAIKRYDANGLHNLKGAGVTTSGCPSPDTSVVGPEGAVIALGEPEPTVTFTDNNVTVTAAGLTGLSVTKLVGTADTGSYDTEAYSAYASYDITPEGYTQGKTATVSIALDAADNFDTSKAIWLVDAANGTEKKLSVENGAVTFTTSHFSTYQIVQKITNGRTYELATSITAGESYVIVGNDNAVALMDNNGSLGSQAVEISGTTLTCEEELTQWTVSCTSGATITSGNGNKLGYSSSSWNLSGSGDCTFDIAAGSNNFSLRVIRASSGYNRYYFYYDGSSWAKNSGSTPSYVRLYQLSDSSSGGTTEPEIPETPDVPETPEVPEQDGSWIALPVTGNTYVLDTDGVDSGATYLIVAKSYAKALKSATGSNNGVTVTLDGNTATADSTDYGWTFTASGDKYTIQNNGTYLGRSSSQVAAGSSSTTWTVTNNGSGNYNVKQTSSNSWWGGSNYNLRWSNSNNTFQASTSSSDAVRLYKHTGSSGIGANYVRLAGETDQNYVIADRADVQTVLDKILLQTSTDGKTADTKTIAVTAEMVSWDVPFNGSAAGTYVGTVTCEGETLGTVTVTVVAAHNFETITVDPTCTEEGSVTTKCTICGEQTVETLEALGHDYTCVTTEATCGKDGSKVYTCGNCDDTYTEVIPATGEHVYTSETKDATCVLPGSVTYTCACGDTYVEEIPAAGHTYESVTTEATCGADGSVVYTCLCGETYTEVLPATGNHVYEKVTVEATCTDAGSVTYTCACGENYVEVLGALGHSYEAVVTAPTCTESGYTTYVCATCGNSYTDNRVEALGHNYTSEITATCTEDGFVVYTCSVCGHSYNGEAVAAYGHDYTTTVVEPTCGKDGYTTYVCATCGHSYTGDIVAAPGHAYGIHVTEATCTEGGFSTYTCANCDDSYVSDYTAALGHAYDSVVTEPTFEEMGYTTHTCVRCGDVVVDSYVPVKTHSYAVETVEATCVTDGYTTYTCTECGYSYTETMAAFGHSFQVATQDPDCTHNGAIVSTCTVCGHVETEMIPALGHDFEVVTIDPGCETEGYTTWTCACGHIETETVAALGHKYQTVTTKPSCTEAGAVTDTCTVCGKEVVEVIPALGHSYVSTSTAPTCETAGYTTYTCSTCGDSYTADEVAALGHAYEAVVTEPACETAGYTTYTCTVCGHSYTGNAVAATGHSYAVQEADGYRVYTCTVCGDSYSEKLSYTYSRVTAFASDNSYVITLKSGNKYYALSHKNDSISAVQVKVSNNKITSEITEDLLWDYSNKKLSYVSDDTAHYLYTYSTGGWWGWGGTPTLSISTSNSSDVSISSTRLKVGSYYLRYSSSKISANSSAGSAYIFVEE